MKLVDKNEKVHEIVKKLSGDELKKAQVLGRIIPRIAHARRVIKKWKVIAEEAERERKRKAAEAAKVAAEEAKKKERQSSASKRSNPSYSRMNSRQY